MNPVSIVALCVSGVMLVFSILTFGQNARKDRESEDASNDEKMENIKAASDEKMENVKTKMENIRDSLIKANMKLDQLCATTNETRTDIKKMDNDIREMDRRVTIVERDMKTAFSRIDDLKRRKNKKRWRK